VSNFKPRHSHYLAGFIACLITLLSLSSHPVTQAQTRYAARLEVTYDGVELRRAGTLRWLPLPDNAIAPLAAGDQLRTDSTGRALLHFGENNQLLLLPQSAYTLEAFRTTPAGTTLHARLDGVGIQTVNDIADFRLEAFNVTITGASGLLGVWSDRLADDSVTVADGHATLQTDTRPDRLEAGQGYRYQPDTPDIQSFPPPLNRARLIGVLDGCPGLVATRDDTRGVLVRTGAGTGYQRRGLIEDNRTVPLLARTQSGFWTRIQYANGFGWVVSDAVSSDCTLPRLPDDTPEEDIRRAINTDPRERELLRPFYGNPALDSWFYAVQPG
jgi:hypothetical protein